jgi:hypothetical protein
LDGVISTWGAKVVPTQLHRFLHRTSTGYMGIAKFTDAQACADNWVAIGSYLAA